MPSPIRTLEETIAWENARLGISRHDSRCDWSGGYDVDDCALFQSTAVFGQKAAWNVDVFETLTGGTYHKGSTGIRRGDVLLYSWNHDGVANHTEMALAAPAGGNVQTVGANGSDTIAVAHRTRPVSYVMGFFRPNYKPAKKPTTAAPAVTTEWSKTMYGFIRNESNGEVAVLNAATGTKRPLGNPEWQGYKANGAKYANLSAADYAKVPTGK